MRVLAGMSINIKYTVALISHEKKKKRLARFSLHFAWNRMTPCVANVHGNHYTSTYFIFSRLSDRLTLIFCNSLSLFLSLFGGWYFKKKWVCVTAHYASVNVHNSRTISWIATWRSMFWSAQPFGWIHILNRVSQSSFWIVAGTCPCIKFVNAGDLEYWITYNVARWHAK